MKYIIVWNERYGIYKSPATRMFYWELVQADNKENANAPQ